MKSGLADLGVIVLSVMTIGLCAGHAQIMNQIDFKTAQPFTVANTTLAAGSYLIRPVPGAGQTVLEVSGASGKPSVIVDVNSVQPDSQNGSHLIFNQYKNVMALSEVFPGGGNTGYQLAQGHPEQMAAKTEQPTKQTVASTAK